MDRLFSQDQLKTYINSNPRRVSAEVTMNMARQLYSTMRELEELKKCPYGQKTL